MLSLRALPSAEQRETHFSTMIEVRVESDYAVPGRSEVDHRSLMWILGWEVDVELINTTGVRGILRPENTFTFFLILNWYNFVKVHIKYSLTR